MMKRRPSPVSRRDALKCAGVALVRCFGLPDPGNGQVRGNNQETQAPLLMSKLLWSAEGAQLLAVAPDGKHACLYFTRHPGESFTFRQGQWTNNNALSGQTDDVLRIIDLSSSKTVFSVQLRARA